MQHKRFIKESKVAFLCAHVVMQVNVKGFIGQQAVVKMVMDLIGGKFDSFNAL